MLTPGFTKEYKDEADMILIEGECAAPTPTPKTACSKKQALH